MRTALFLVVAFFFCSCSSVDDYVAKAELPVDQTAAIAAALVEAFPASDLDGNGYVPSSLDELMTLVAQIRARL